MQIFNMTYNWKGVLSKRAETKYIILHHRGGCGDALSIHADHLKRGWSGIGYHFYVRKDGSVFKGRPIGTVGAHCTNYNSLSIGICFEGNFENEVMTDVQIKSGRELVAYIRQLYPKAEVKRHRDFSATACPGKNFVFEKISKGVTQMTIEEAMEIVQAKAGLEDETIEFLLCYKYGEELFCKLAEAMR